MHKSIATIDAPQFINLQPLDINPLMSKCEIKVLYVGQNRNRSYISKEVATEMSKTLRGAPIVGYYKEQKEDFADHGNQMILDDEGFHFNCLTVPYGFVAPDAQVWFQTFEDTDDFGNVEVREYLMTTGYLWTGQFEECKLAVEGQGRPHSMELDEASLSGRWAEDKKSGMEFFIINDATFSKLCILGKDVEPCFEGSSVTAPEVSSKFTKVDEGFKKTLYSMMQELQFALQGGQQMDNENIVATEVTVEDAPAADFVEEEVAVVNDEQQPSEVAPESEPVNDEVSLEEAEPVVNNEEFAKKNDEEDEDNNSDDKDNDGEKSSDASNDDNNDPEDNDEDDDEKKKKYALLEQNYQLLQQELEAVKAERDELAAFKLAIEDAQKDAMINKFYFLADEDKKDVIENKSKYTLEEIESKLSVMWVRKRVNFDLDDNNKTDIDIEEPIYTYTAVDNVGASQPAWITAVKSNQKK